MCIGKTISIFSYVGNSRPRIEKSFKYIDKIVCGPFFVQT